MKTKGARAIRGQLGAVALAVCALTSLIPPASATHWTGTAALDPLNGFSGEINRFTFRLNNGAAEAVSVYAVTMIACWHAGGQGSPIKEDSGVAVTVPPMGSGDFVGDISVPPLANGLCHTAVVVKGKAPSDSDVGHVDYHFDVNYTSRPALTIAISLDNSTGNPPLHSQMNATAAGGAPPYVIQWDFGDGDNATGPDVGHTFLTTGRFEVAATVTDSGGRRAVASQVVWVYSGLAVNATAAPSIGDAPVQVTLRATAVGASGVAQYNWSLGDGTFGVGEVVNHSYESAGAFTAVLEATDGAAQHANASVVVTVFRRLLVSMIADPMAGAAPLRVRFAGLLSNETGSFAYHWVFGDGEFATSRNVTHTFASPGQYKVALHVTDTSSGRVYSTEAQITVGPPQPPQSQPAPGLALAALSLTAAAVVAEWSRRKR